MVSKAKEGQKDNTTLGTSYTNKSSLTWAEQFIPQRFSELVFFSESQLRVLKWLTNSLKTQKNAILLLLGPVGCGKTLLAASVARMRKCKTVDVSVEDIDALIDVPTNTLRKERILYIIDDPDSASFWKYIPKIRKISSPFIVTSSSSYFPNIDFPNDKGSSEMLLKVPAPQREDIVKALKVIVQRSGLNVSPLAIRRIAEVSDGDFRAAINDMQLLGSHKSTLKYLRTKNKTRIAYLCQQLFQRNLSINDIERSYDPRMINMCYESLFSSPINVEKRRNISKILEDFSFCSTLPSDYTFLSLTKIHETGIPFQYHFGRKEDYLKWLQNGVCLSICPEKSLNLCEPKSSSLKKTTYISTSRLDDFYYKYSPSSSKAVLKDVTLAELLGFPSSL